MSTERFPELTREEIEDLYINATGILEQAEFVFDQIFKSTLDVDHRRQAYSMRKLIRGFLYAQKSERERLTAQFLDIAGGLDNEDPFFVEKLFTDLDLRILADAVNSLGFLDGMNAGFEARRMFDGWVDDLPVNLFDPRTGKYAESRPGERLVLRHEYAVNTFLEQNPGFEIRWAE